MYDYLFFYSRKEQEYRFVVYSCDTLDEAKARFFNVVRKGTKFTQIVRIDHVV